MFAHRNDCNTDYKSNEKRVETIHQQHSALAIKSITCRIERKIKCELTFSPHGFYYDYCVILLTSHCDNLSVRAKNRQVLEESKRVDNTSNC